MSLSLCTYDANGNLRRIVNPRGVDQDTDTQRVVDDGSSGNENLVDASENATVLRYDEHDLLVAERMPWNAGDERKFRRLFKRADAEEDTDNRLRRLISLVSPHEVTDEGASEEDDVARTSHRYFANDWIRSISDQKLVDPNSNMRIESRLIENDYDRRGAQAEWKTKHFGETSAGRHITRTFWPSGELRTRTAKKVADPDEPPTRRRYEYLYNRNGSLVRMVDEDKSRTTTMGRDAVERQTRVNELWVAGQDTLQTFDLAGNVVTRKTDGKIQPDGSFAGADAKTTTFDYDSLDREIRMVVDPATGSNRVTTTNYWPSGRRQSRTKPNGTTERWFYTTRGEASRLERDGQNGLDPLVVYRYDANGNRDRDERGRYEYNARDQLVLWQKPGSADQHDPDDEDYTGQITRYRLNGDGAIIEKSVQSGAQPPVITEFRYRGERLQWAGTDQVRAFYRYDDFGSVVSVRQHALVGGQFPPVDDRAPQSTDCEDVPGTVASDETYYCYDEFERLRLSKGAGVDDPELLEYDGLDRRDARIERVGGNDVRRDLSYVGTSELLSRETHAGGEKRFYDYDSAGDRQGQQVTDGAANRYRAYSKDANGSVLALEDDDGDVEPGERYDYDPYGELESPGTLDAEGDANPFRFQGFYYDSGVQSYDMHAREYRPEHGRFLTQDRYASASQDLLMQADALSQNRYAFAGANPVNNIEFDGHRRIDCVHACAISRPPTKTERRKERAYWRRRTAREAPGWNRYYESEEYQSGRGISTRPPALGIEGSSAEGGPRELNVMVKRPPEPGQIASGPDPEGAALLVAEGLVSLLDKRRLGAAWRRIARLTRIRFGKPQFAARALTNQERLLARKQALRNAPEADEGIGYADPNKIRFTQNEASPRFRDGRTVRQLIDEYRAGKSPDEVKEIAVARLDDGQMFSLDNRRLYAAQQAGVPIRFRMATKKEIADQFWNPGAKHPGARKFDTDNYGTSIRIRPK